MKTSATIDKIASAFLKAQAQMGGAKKGANNPFFRSKYADFGAVLEACKDALNDNDISILQPTGQNEKGEDVVITVLLHTSGQYFAGETTIVAAKQNDPQAYGSAVTYARRYGLQSITGLPSEDDDAEGAMSRGKTQTYEAKPKYEKKAKEAPAQEAAPKELPASDAPAAPEKEPAKEATKKPASFRSNKTETKTAAKSKGGW